jgi:ABC-type multidrug transport system fused ATPase/permease subunit
MLFSALVNVAGIGSFLPFMQLLMNPDSIVENRLLNSIYSLIPDWGLQQFSILVGLFAMAFFIVGNVSMIILTYVMGKFSASFTSDLSSRLFYSYLKQPYLFYLDRNSSELAKNIFSEVRQVVNGVISPMMRLIARALLAIAIIFFLAIVDPIVTLMVVSVAGGFFLVTYSFSRRLLGRIGDERVAAEKGRYQAVTEAFSGIKLLKLYNKERFFLEVFLPLAEKAANLTRKVQMIGMIPKYYIEILAFTAIMGVALINAAVGNNIAQLIPMLSVYLLAGYRLLPALQEVYLSMSQIRSSLASIDLVYSDLINAKHSVRIDEIDSEGTPIEFFSDISLKGLNFSYPDSPGPTLSQINLTVEKDTSLGIIGKTGSGKTTLVDIILGLLLPVNGTFAVDGNQLDENTIHAWQKLVGYVPQDIFLADMTIAENIAFGIQKNDIDMEKVIEAAINADINDFITSELPQGYQTVVGERGVRLSGGERQRIGIARALYNKPEVIVLDEATSALDDSTEEAVMGAIKALSHKKTLIIIAHRITTLSECDRIIKLQNGRIVQSGTYQELFGQNGDDDAL